MKPVTPKDPGGELSGLQSSASATMAKKLRRSSSAELTGQGGQGTVSSDLTTLLLAGGSGSGLLASDVARLVASPEIGATLAVSCAVVTSHC